MVVITMSCSTNCFDGAEPCLSEAFIRQPIGGAIAYLGSSRAGWGTLNINSLGSSFQISALFFEYLFKGISLNFAKIVKLIKSHYGYSASSYGSFRWLLFSNNAIFACKIIKYILKTHEKKNKSIQECI